MAFFSPFGQLYTSSIIMQPEAIPIQQITTNAPNWTPLKKANDNLRPKKISPFDPEATVPMPFQLDDRFGPFSTSVWKRNERERYRVRCVNEGYDKLRNHLPVADGEKRISKVDTLRLAIRYIKHLDAVLKNDQHVYRCRCFHGFKEESEGNVQIDVSRFHQ